MNNSSTDFYDEKPEKQPPSIEQVRQACELIMKSMPQVLELITHLKNLPYRTPEEEKQLKELIDTGREILPYVTYAKDFLGERLYMQATAIYHRAKELAQQGDSEAQKVVDDLKPLYEDALREQMSDN